MKQLMLLIITAVSIVSFGQAKVEGSWVGTIDAGVKLRLVFNIKKTGENNYSATLDSPDQGARGIPCSAVKFSGDSLLIDVGVINGKYAGVFVSDTTVSGSWNQSGARLALSLTKTTQLPKLNRPQTPKPPYSYQVKEVEYDNADHSVHLAGTITYPSGLGKFPTAILISGSGQQDRDETIYGHKPFAVIADHLTKLGFAVLRVDDRGTGGSTGEVENASSEDFAKDVETSIAYLKTLPMVDTNKIGLIGHSEGGLIAALVASRRSDIDFVVFLAAPGTKGSDLLADQVEAVLISEGTNADAVKAYLPFYKKVMGLVLNSTDTSGIFNKAWIEFEKWKTNTTDNQRKDLGFTSDTASAIIIKGLIRGFAQPWMKFFLNTDPRPFLKKMETKVLALNGSKDLQVPATQNLKGIRKALKKSRSKIVTIKELHGLNHLFQTCEKCTITEYGLLEETFATEALREISTWLEAHILKSK